MRILAQKKLMKLMKMTKMMKKTAHLHHLLTRKKSMKHSQNQKKRPHAYVLLESLKNPVCLCHVARSPIYPANNLPKLRLPSDCNLKLLQLLRHRTAPSTNHTKNLSPLQKQNTRKITLLPRMRPKTVKEVLDLF